jgi:hypothetical protein
MIGSDLAPGKVVRKAAEQQAAAIPRPLSVD